jgi:hypothetical protein
MERKEEKKRMERKGEKKENKLIFLIAFYSFVASFRVGGL